MKEIFVSRTVRPLPNAFKLIPFSRKICPIVIPSGCRWIEGQICSYLFWNPKTLILELRPFLHRLDSWNKPQMDDLLSEEKSPCIHSKWTFSELLILVQTIYKCGFIEWNTIGKKLKNTPSFFKYNTSPDFIRVF